MEEDLLLSPGLPKVFSFTYAKFTAFFWSFSKYLQAWGKIRNPLLVNRITSVLDFVLNLYNTIHKTE